MSPDAYNWATHYPAHFPPQTTEPLKKVEFADIGCGYGGLIGMFYNNNYFFKYNEYIFIILFILIICY